MIKKRHFTAYVLGANRGEYVRHKNGGPAFISHDNGSCEWWAYDLWYEYTIDYCKALGFSKMKTMQWVLKYGEILPTHIDMC
jgi:hypothetical protein